MIMDTALSSHDPQSLREGAPTTMPIGYLHNTTDVTTEQNSSLNNAVLAIMENASDSLCLSSLADCYQNTNTSDGPVAVPEPPTYIIATATVVYIVIFLLGVVGNSLVSFVVWRNKDMRNSTNFFLVNLSVSDLLVIVVCMPTALVDIYSKEVWHFGAFMCKLVPFLEHVVADASVLTILAISFERYYAICRPLEAQYTCTFRRMLKVVCVVWLITGCCCLPFLWITVYKDSRFLDNTPIKVCRAYIDKEWKLLFILLRAVIFFALPFFLLVGIYAVISRKLMTDTSIRRTCEKNSQSNHRARRQVTMMLIAVVALFFTCNLPLNVVGIWLSFATKEDMIRMGLEGYLNLIYFCRCMFYLNSTVNPIAYNMFSSKFREAFKRVLGLRLRQRRLSAMPTVTSWQSCEYRRESSVLQRSSTLLGGRNTCSAVRYDSSQNGTQKRAKLHITFNKLSTSEKTAQVGLLSSITRNGGLAENYSNLDLLPKNGHAI